MGRNMLVKLKGYKLLQYALLLGDTENSRHKSFLLCQMPDNKVFSILTYLGLQVLSDLPAVLLLPFLLLFSQLGANLELDGKIQSLVTSLFVDHSVLLEVSEEKLQKVVHEFHSV